MAPEIEFVLNSQIAVSPADLHKQFPFKSAHSIHMSLKRAVKRGTIKRVDYGLYAHPKYMSPADRMQEFHKIKYGMLITVLSHAYYFGNESMYWDVIDYYVETMEADLESLLNAWKSLEGQAIAAAYPDPSTLNLRYGLTLPTEA